MVTFVPQVPEVPRVYGTREAPLFVAADVCKCLNLGNTSLAMYRLDPSDRTHVTLCGGKGNRNVNAVTEAGAIDFGCITHQKPGGRNATKGLNRRGLLLLGMMLRDPEGPRG